MPMPAFAPVERPCEPASLDVFEGLFSEGAVKAVGVFVLVLLRVEVFRVLSGVGAVEVYRRKCLSMVPMTKDSGTPALTTTSAPLPWIVV